MSTFRRYIVSAAVIAAAFGGSLACAQAYMIDPTTKEPIIARPSSARGSSIPRETIAYETAQRPGTIVVNTTERRLYLIMDGGKALRYGIGVGRDGFQWGGAHNITMKREWPDWRPPAPMLKRQPNLPRHMPGGPQNPLGARALYLGSSIYRIHGSNEPWTIGTAVSSGCFRMTNDDVSDLYERVGVGTRVVVMR